jgi:hypothetical protein
MEALGVASSVARFHPAKASLVVLVWAVAGSGISPLP